MNRCLIPALLFVLLFSLSDNLAASGPGSPIPPDKPQSPTDTAVSVSAVDTMQYWKLTASGRLSLNQVAFTNWAEGGESNVASSAYGTVKANYLNDQFKSDNFLNLGYGMTWNEEQGLRKTDDRIDAGMSVGYEAFEDWFYNIMVNLKTQFSPGYKYPDDSTIVSRFFSPATLYVSMGMEYKPDENTSIFLSPASGKFTLVLDDDLANSGAFGVTPAVVDSLGNILVPGMNYRSNFGINLVIYLDRDLMKNVNMESKLNLHNNYLDESVNNRWNFDVDWETALNFRINHFLSSNLFIHLLYDHDIPIPTYKYIQGEKVMTGQGPRLQVKENFGIGLALKV